MRAPALVVLAVFALAACGSPARTAPGRAGPVTAAPLTGTLPPIPAVTGPLRVDLVYPESAQVVTATDSTFVFGSVGTAQAWLWINGERVDLAPNGAFLAFLPVPPDGFYHLYARAHRGGEVATATRTVQLPAFAAPPVAEAGGIVPVSITPTGRFAGRAGEPFTLRVRAAAGARARLILPGGDTIPFETQRVREPADGFMVDAPPREWTEYVATFPLTVPWTSPDTTVAAPLLGAGVMAPPAFVEVVNGDVVTRTPVPLSVSVLPAGGERVVEVASDRIDGFGIATAIAGPGTPYHWFFPNGTRLRVTGERGNELRVQLTQAQTVWFPTAHARLLPESEPPPRGAVASIRAIPADGHVDVVLATSERLPFHVLPGADRLSVEVYGAETRTNWLYYGADDPLIDRLDWTAVSDDIYRLDIELTGPLWGYMPFWNDAGHLVLRVRRPPALDRGDPLRGLYIGIDAGHPPGGAIGPTRYTETEANLAISKRLAALLRQRGARVLETRPDTAVVGLAERPQMATDSGVHLLISVHNNAFPDGVNPFENAGTSVLFNRPQSVAFARHMQRELVRELGLRDLGIIWGDLALARPTWMPSVLTETMFLMVPRQEAALRDPDVHERIARAHVRAIEAFLRERVR